MKDVSKYALAASEAGRVIDNAADFGFGLLDDFVWLWDSTHFYNEESVFSLYYQQSSLADDWEQTNRCYLGQIFDYYNGCFRTDSSSPYLQIILPHGSEINFFNNFPAGYRKDVTFYDSIYYSYEDYSTLVDSGYYIHIDHTGNCSRMAYRKFFYFAQQVDLHQLIPDYTPQTYIYYVGIPRIYLFRYAQTILTYAEAAARSGQLDDRAYSCVNAIRRRAHHLDLFSPSVWDLPHGLSPEAFADSVVTERGWELAAEPEGRWFDLVRLEMVEDLPNLRAPGEGGPPYTFDKSVYFFPIPASDRLLNPNLGYLTK